ncbi:metal-dependent hydrolase [Tritonibacter mobilis]|uniref:metal-dependent hydrolase n=1 Tax=Tritonibacter mobilis TaxID=379347 RepID=UPI000806A3E1|nr:metal-dependent hydrolase [Tritonibacter mobilis]GLP87845.1 metal-dependent hydrolase [Tritonibacter mobilis]SDX47686.1 LexA-binding, inner membrane-associated putative hydrolase [Tritonibacter mobilis]
MLTAHLPSGYILAQVPRRTFPGLLPVALIGAVFPDLDMIWFYFVDDRAFHHHRYWVHVPAFWAGVALVTLPLIGFFARRWLNAALVFFAAIFMHLVLDSIGGGIMWLAPLDDRLMSLTVVPATQDHWVLSFLLHWTFLLELAIWGLALTLWLRRGRVENRASGGGIWEKMKKGRI